MRRSLKNVWGITLGIFLVGLVAVSTLAQEVPGEGSTMPAETAPGSDMPAAQPADAPPAEITPTGTAPTNTTSIPSAPTGMEPQAAASSTPDTATSSPAAATPTSATPAALRPTAVPAATPIPATIPPVVSTTSPTIPVETATSIPEDAPTPAAPNPNFWLVLFGGGAVLAALIYGAWRWFSQKPKPMEDKKDGGEACKCDNIKSLLEQKKQELAEMVRDWPKDKLEEIAKEAGLNLLKKNKQAAVVAEAAESAADKYARLEEAIDLLQTRFDLCNLSLPEAGETLYRGTIIKNSLSDPAVLDDLKITRTYSAGDWTLVDVQVNEKQAEKLGRVLEDGPWYMHFWQENKDEVLVCFKEANFKIEYSDRNSWVKAINHGTQKGIPPEQLDFKIGK